MYFAELSILVMTAMTLSVYDISDLTDEAGVPLTAAKATYSGGTIRYAVMASGFDPHILLHSHPDPFRCSIVPRSGRTKALILALKQDE